MKLNMRKERDVYIEYTKKHPFRPLYTRKEIEEREQAMNELHPGFLDMKLKLSILLGAVLFTSGLNIVISGMLGIVTPTRSVVNFLTLAIVYYYYRVFIHGGLRLLNIAVLGVHILDLGVTLLPLLGYIFHMNTVGIVWLIVYTISMLIDIFFLTVLLVNDDAKQHMNFNRQIYFKEESIGKERPYGNLE